MVKNLFQNKQVGAVAAFDLSLIGIGAAITVLTGSSWGLWSMIAGIILLAYGWKSLSPDPYTVGALTSWGQMITKEVDSNKTATIAVKGMVVLFPPFLDIIPIVMTNKEWVFNKELLSVEKGVDAEGKHLNVPLKGKIAMTVGPDETDLFDYVKAGRIDAIEGQIEPIVFRESQKLVTTKVDPIYGHVGLSAKAISQHGQLISDDLQTHVNGHDEIDANGIEHHVDGIFEEKSFGIKCKKVQIDFPLPQEVRDAMIDALSIMSETAARQTEYKGDIAAAKELGAALGITDGPKTMEALRQLRLMRDGKMTENIFAIEGRGTVAGGVINLIGVPLPAGGNQQQGGDNQGKKRKKGNQS